ncbi:MAG: retron St85 family RNA-directed DNA polymerase [Erysipelotrichaceae bacterium]|uniref:retron St85 family RNA-directed DNA polymerase n=1 Tax=Anaerorhabdus sp. TaxID=1872524 RepID=UPI002FC76DA4
MEQYLENLKREISLRGYDEEYINTCVKYATRLKENNLPVIFDLIHLALLLGITDENILHIIYSEEYFYKIAHIPKKNGKTREINIPSNQLKYIQRWILDNILYNIKISEYATGFCKKKSIVDNAKVHVNNTCLINMDIKDFFTSIKFHEVYKIFKYYGYTKEISFALTKLCTFQGKLPQGSPTSPVLSNIVCLKLDKRLSLLAKKYNATYTRYADDITFSGSSGIEKVKEICEKILHDEQFEVNMAKTRISYHHERQEVTGLIVNNGQISINRKYKREIYKNLYYCKKYGVNSHLDMIKSNKLFYKEHMYGKAYFVKMIEPNEGKKILDLLDEIEWDY